MTEKIIALKTNADSLQNPYDSDAKDDKDSLIKLVQKFTVKPYQKKSKKPKKLKLDKLKKYSKKDITIKDILGHSIEKTFDQKISSNLEELLVKTESISDFLSLRILKEKNKSIKQCKYRNWFEYKFPRIRSDNDAPTSIRVGQIRKMPKGILKQRLPSPPPLLPPLLSRSSQR